MVQANMSSWRRENMSHSFFMSKKQCGSERQTEGDVFGTCSGSRVNKSCDGFKIGSRQIK